MRFAPTDDHRPSVMRCVTCWRTSAPRGRAVGLARARCGWPGPRRRARAASGAVPALWGRLSEMGVLSLLVPEADGGMGFDEVAAALVLEETGYSAVPLPVVETMCVGAPLAASSDLWDGPGVAVAAAPRVAPSSCRGARRVGPS